MQFCEDLVLVVFPSFPSYNLLLLSSYTRSPTMIHQPTSCYDNARRDERPLTYEDPKRRRRVRFNTSETIHAASPYLLPATRKERKHLWYRKKEFKLFAEQDREIAASYRLAKKRNQDVSHLEVRGLQFQLSIEANTAVRSRVASVTKLVLGEQSRQRMNGVVNPSILRALSLGVTRRAQHVAYKLAKQDELNAAATEDDEEPLKTIDTNSVSTTNFRRPAAKVTIDRQARMIILDYVLPQPLLA